MVTLSICAAASLGDLWLIKGYLSPTQQYDFEVYFTASSEIAQHLDAHLYDESGNGLNPQLRDADPSGTMAHVARQQGIQQIKLYLYPPLLADLLQPVARLKLPDALLLWRSLNIGFLILASLSIAALLRKTWWTLPSLIVFSGLLCFSPIWQALHYGQITLLLLFLWATGILAYAKGWTKTSAVLLGIASLLKLTPLLAVVPLLIWRDWRWLRSFGLTLAIGLGAMVFINSPHVVMFYAQHVVPPMSSGIGDRQNQTVLSVLQVISSGRHPHLGKLAPTSIAWTGHILSGLLVAIAVFLTVLRQKNLSTSSKPIILAAFALLSLCVSPVSWVDAFAIGYILIALQWNHSFVQKTSIVQLLLLTASTAALGGSLAIKHIHKLDSFLFAQYLPLFFAIYLVFFTLLPSSISPTEHPHPCS
ncbi:glycosyltransferase family 87 protein [Granulicella tundricola]|uniref:glycosyltransferase family 87 protein n=1 Tax=Granulicella tundricola TaxID=940615 RepID=UPI0018DC0487|nr:glycosyltransferase family 87 protein [Granulicella tundricola]